MIYDKYIDKKTGLVEPYLVRTTRHKGYEYPPDPAVVLTPVSSIVSAYPKPWMGKWVANMFMDEFCDWLNSDSKLRSAWTPLADLKKADDGEAYRKRRAVAVNEVMESNSTARDKGSVIHQFFEASYVKRKVITPKWMDKSTVDECRMRAANIVAAIQARGFDVLQVEVCVFGRDLGYAGTIDAIAERNGKYYILDVKTGARLGGAIAAQLSAYYDCPEVLERDGEWSKMPELEGVYVVHNTGTSVEETQFHSVDTIRGWSLFADLMDVYEASKTKNERALFELVQEWKDGE